MAAAATATPASAQSDAGGLRILVQDTSDGPMPGADIVVTNVATNVVDRRVSNEEGYAIVTPLARGTYVIDITFPGFQPVRVRDVEVDVQQMRLIRTQLQPATVTEAIEVTAQAAPVQSEEGSLGQVLKSQVIVELPLGARRYSDLVLLAPGATASTLDVTSRGPGWFVVNGTSHTQNNFTLDGFDNNQGTTNMESLSAQVVQPSPDAIAELKVQTNSFSAEFGRSAGAVVNVSLKSGTNALHGSGWYYNRDKALAATSWQSNLTDAGTDDLRWNQYGGTLGGPTLRSRLFFFGHYEGFNSDRSDFNLTQVPTLDQRRGVFPFQVLDPATGQPFPNNTIPANRQDPLGVKLANLFPEPNLPGRVVSGGRTVENYAVSRPSTEETHKFDTRHDLNLSAADRVFVRYSFLQQDIFRNAIFDAPADDGGSTSRTTGR